MSDDWRDQEIIRLTQIIHEHRERDRKVENTLDFMKIDIDRLKEMLSSKIK